MLALLPPPPPLRVWNRCGCTARRVGPGGGGGGEPDPCPPILSRLTDCQEWSTSNRLPVAPLPPPTASPIGHCVTPWQPPLDWGTLQQSLVPESPQESHPSLELHSSQSSAGGGGGTSADGVKSPTVPSVPAPAVLPSVGHWLCPTQLGCSADDSQQFAVHSPVSRRHWLHWLDGWSSVVPQVRHLGG